MEAGVRIHVPPPPSPVETGKTTEKRENYGSKIIVYALGESDSLLNSFSRLQDDFESKNCRKWEAK